MLFKLLDGLKFKLDNVTWRIVKRLSDGLFLIEDEGGDRVRRTQDELHRLQDLGRLKPTHTSSPFALSLALPVPTRPDLTLLADGSTSPAEPLDNAEKKQRVLQRLSDLAHITSIRSDAQVKRKEALKTEGFSESTHRTTVWRWKHSYEHAGFDGLKGKRPGPKGPWMEFFAPTAKEIIEELNPRTRDQTRKEVRTSLLSTNYFKTTAKREMVEENVKRSREGTPLLKRVPSFTWFRNHS